MIPSDAELAALITEYGVPVRLSVGEYTVVLGWLHDSDRDDVPGAVAGLLRAAVQTIEENR